jgi:hypothetical protein
VVALIKVGPVDLDRVTLPWLNQAGHRNGA